MFILFLWATIIGALVTLYYAHDLPPIGDLGKETKSATITVPFNSCLKLY